MQFQAVFDKKERPVLIAGPCSAETEAQVLDTAHALAEQGIDLFRAGIWKPRTRPDSFEGVGSKGLAWLRRVKKETGLRVTTEVANANHVYEALKFGIDVLWIGARTTVNPFSVQEIADALRGVDVPVMVKNPINPDLKLWIGALERLHKAGIRRIAAIHRGFSYFGDTAYRNLPRWQIPLELKRRFPDMQLICDNSHICGRRDTLLEVAQKALDLNFDGLMTEVHPCPDKAWSDPAQQLTPVDFAHLVGQLVVRQPTTRDAAFLETLENLRHEIDELDDELFDLLARRMQVAERIAHYKRRNNISIFQPGRWTEIIRRSVAKGQKLGLSREFVEALLKAIHDESINHQEKVMRQAETEHTKT